MNISWIVGIVFIAFGIIFLLISIMQKNRAKAAEAWPTLPGVILSSELKERRSYNSKTHHTSITYEPQVQYEYTLMGTKYTGKQIGFGYASYNYNVALSKIAPYPQGAAVQVRYDPDDPAKAVLETKAAGGTVMIVVAVIFLVLGLAMIVLQLI